MPITEEMREAGVEVLDTNLNAYELVAKIYRAMRDAKQREAIKNYRQQYGWERNV